MPSKRRLFWRDVLWRPIMFFVFAPLGLLGVAYLFVLVRDEFLPSRFHERWRLLNLLRYVSWYWWIIATLLVLTFLTVEGSLRQLSKTAQGPPIEIPPVTESSDLAPGRDTGESFTEETERQVEAERARLDLEIKQEQLRSLKEQRQAANPFEAFGDAAKGWSELLNKPRPNIVPIAASYEWVVLDNNTRLLRRAHQDGPGVLYAHLAAFRNDSVTGRTVAPVADVRARVTYSDDVYSVTGYWLDENGDLTDFDVDAGARELVVALESKDKSLFLADRRGADRNPQYPMFHTKDVHATSYAIKIALSAAGTVVAEFQYRLMVNDNPAIPCMLVRPSVPHT